MTIICCGDGPTAWLKMHTLCCALQVSSLPPLPHCICRYLQHALPRCLLPRAGPPTRGEARPSVHHGSTYPLQEQGRHPLPQLLQTPRPPGEQCPEQEGVQLLHHGRQSGNWELCRGPGQVSWTRKVRHHRRQDLLPQSPRLFTAWPGHTQAK